MSKIDFNAACLVEYEGAPDEQRSAHPTRVCVVDAGTNSFHTVIVDVYPNGSFEVLDKIKEMVRLGERGLSGGRLTEAAMRRAVRALKRVRILAEGWKVTDYLAFATSAIREASNGGALIERVRAEAGIHLQAISGELEAHLIYQGVRRAVDMHVPTLLVDIGGGSTEFIVGTSEEVYYQTSLKLGAARMTRAFITTDPVERDEFRALRDHYRQALEPVFEAARAHGVREIVGSSGTIENVAQVYVDRYGDADRSIYLQDFEPKSLRKVTKQLMQSTKAEREAEPAIDDKRVQQIVAGAILVDVLLKDLEIERVRISPNALREGMVVFFIEHNHGRLEVVSPYGDVRRRSVSEVGSRFGWDEKHVQHVTAMTLQLFDACRSLHGLGSRERELLEYASLLHDIGYYISRTAHHKHSLYLIRQADWLGFLPEEIDVMANVARYHRKSLPKEKHPAFRRLSPENQTLVRQIAAFLRLANALDRSHYQNVVALSLELTDERLELEVATKGDPQLELWSARRSADLFEQVYGRKVRVRSVQAPPGLVKSGGAEAHATPRDLRAAADQAGFVSTKSSQALSSK